ncbi:hypothetical protein Tco_0494199 [Tanacetum coccineum]
MRTDELHKFSDGTFNHVRTTLNDIAIGIQMDYLTKRRWSPQDKRRARVMISAIDRKLRDRRLMRSLEKFVGGRPEDHHSDIGKPIVFGLVTPQGDDGGGSRQLGEVMVKVVVRWSGA